LARTLLNECVQKIEQFIRLPRLSATGKAFGGVVSLLILVATSLRAGEPVMTLTTKQPPETISAAAPADLKSDTNNPLLNVQPESFPLVREDSHPNKPVTVQAGYGRIWDDQSTLQKIACDHQEPGCAYVSANFSF
jgi:hypothetical protein